MLEEFKTGTQLGDRVFQFSFAIDLEIKKTGYFYTRFFCIDFPSEGEELVLTSLCGLIHLGFQSIDFPSEGEVLIPGEAYEQPVSLFPIN